MFACFHVYFGFLGIFVPSHNRGILLTQKMEPRWLIPGAIPCADLLQQLKSVCLSFPISPLVRAGWCPQVPPWPARHIPLLASLSSPQTPVGTSGLSGGAICGCWQWARSPQVKIKYDDYPARLPTPLPVGWQSCLTS